MSIPFPVVPWQESVLQHCAESTFMFTPDDIRGRLTETPRGPGPVSDFALELTIPLSDKGGTRFLSMLVGNRMESPQWEEGSFEWLEDLIRGRRRVRPSSLDDSSCCLPCILNPVDAFTPSS